MQLQITVHRQNYWLTLSQLIIYCCNQFIYELPDLLLQKYYEHFGNAEYVEGKAQADRSSSRGTLQKECRLNKLNHVELQVQVEETLCMEHY